MSVQQTNISVRLPIRKRKVLFVRRKPQANSLDIFPMFRSFAYTLLTISVCLCFGCGKDETYVDEMEILPQKEELAEFSLGKYMIPLPVNPLVHATEWSHGNPMYLSFDLFVVVKPNDISKIERAWARSEGRFRDEVLTTCRQANLDELTEPTLATLKGKLIRVAIRRFDEHIVRRIVINEIKVRPL